MVTPSPPSKRPPSFDAPPSVAPDGAPSRPLKKRKKESGIEMSRTESPTVVRTSRVQLMEAIELVPFENKAAFLEANSLVPELVEEESNPLVFIRFDAFDFFKAAARLTNYWTQRKSVFGDRAFKPLNLLSGDGALTNEEVEMMACGVNVLLPNDSTGRPVLLRDSSRSVTSGTDMFEKRSMFYWFMKCAMSNPLSQTDGIVVLRRVTSSDINGKSFKYFLSLLKDAIPVKMHRIHFCCLPPPEFRFFFNSMVIPVLEQFMVAFMGDLVCFHKGTSEAEIKEKLCEHGLEEDAFPSTLGGSWKYESFYTWIREQNGSLASMPLLPAAVASSGVRLSGKEKTEMRKVRKRVIDAEYARQRRLREREEQDVIERERVRLMKENQGLEEDNKRLELLLVAANEAVSVWHSESTSREGSSSESIAEATSASVSEGLPAVARSNLEAALATVLAQRASGPQDTEPAPNVNAILEALRLASEGGVGATAASVPPDGGSYRNTSHTAVARWKEDGIGSTASSRRPGILHPGEDRVFSRELESQLAAAVGQQNGSGTVRGEPDASGLLEQLLRRSVEGNTVFQPASEPSFGRNHSSTGHPGVEAMGLLAPTWRMPEPTPAVGHPAGVSQHEEDKTASLLSVLMEQVQRMQQQH